MLYTSQVDKLRVHLKYFCGEGAERTDAQARQRRNHDNSGGLPSGRSTQGKGKKDTKSQKKTMETEKKMPQRTKKAGDYDSESELSDLDPKVFATGRASRKASVAASKRLSSSKKEWGAEKNEDSDEYEDPDDSTDDESSEDEAQSKRKMFPQKADKKKVIKAESSDEDSDESDGVARARRKQEEALAQASKERGNGKKVGAKKMALIKKKTSKKKPAKEKGKGKGNKKTDDSSDEESSDDEKPSDPMDGIDMDALMKEAMDGSRMSLLHSLCWWRIVLDEGHMIKSRSSQTASAAFALIAIYRWCLSGTPLQNRVGEFYSLIRFLRIDPMAHYFCRAKVRLKGLHCDVSVCRLLILCLFSGM